MHANAELADDLIKAIILVTSTLAAIFSARAHKKAKAIDKAVNGVTDPTAKTLRENVEQIAEDSAATRREITAAPPGGQAGG